MIIRVVLAMAVTAAIATTARSQALQGGMSGVGTIQVQPDVVPPLRSFRVQPETTPAIPADPPTAAPPPAAEDASLSSPEAPSERTSAPAT